MFQIDKVPYFISLAIDMLKDIYYFDTTISQLKGASLDPNREKLVRDLI